MPDAANKVASLSKAEVFGLPEDMMDPYRHALRFIAGGPIAQMEEAISLGLADMRRADVTQLECCIDLVAYVFALPRGVVQEDLQAEADTLAEARGIRAAAEHRSLATTRRSR